MFRKIYSNIKNRSLYVNSFYLMINSAVLTISGFLFWLYIAQLYSPSSVGIATTLSTSVQMISGISILGLSAGLMRHIPTAKSLSKMLNSTIIIVSVFCLLLSAVYLLFLSKISPELSFVQDNSLYILIFILFALCTSLNDLQESVLIALKRVITVLQKNVIASISKFMFPMMLVSLGSYGIFSSIFLSLVLSVLFGFVILVHATGYRFKIAISKKDIWDIAPYSFGSFISGQVSNISGYIFPILITSIISPSATAYFFVTSSLANILFIIPKMVTQNLLVEGSYDEPKIRSHVLHSLFIIFSLYIPSALCIVLFGQTVLKLFGKDYSSEGFYLLQLLAFSGLFVCVNYVFGTILLVKKKVSLLILCNSITSISLVGLSFYLLKFGIAGIGYATIFAQVTLTIIFISIFALNKKLRI